MTERDIRNIPWIELTAEEQEVILARDRERFPELIAAAERKRADAELPPSVEMGARSCEK